MVTSYGDTTAEYVALHSSSAVVEGRYEMVAVRGPDAISFLDGILSQDIVAMDDGSVARSFLLQPQGKLTAVLWVLRGVNECVLVADHGYGEVAARELRRFLLRVQVEIDEVVTAVRTVIGPTAGADLAATGIDPPDGWVRRADTIVANLPLVKGIARFAVAGPADLDTLPMAGSVAADALRVETGDAVMGIDIDEKTIPQETGLVPSAVSFTKGCYLGQELVARIDSRGHVNRRLVAIRVGSNVLPPGGAELLAAGKAVGLLTSPTESLELRSPVGLALLRREIEVGAEVEIRWDGGTTTGTVAELPAVTFTDS